MGEFNHLLILGAGASRPYGFPCGPGLFSQISETLRLSLHEIKVNMDTQSCFETGKFYRYDQPIHRIAENARSIGILETVLKYELSNREPESKFHDSADREEVFEDIELFYKRLNECGRLTIDEFMRLQPEELQRIGKGLIAAHLILCEQDNHIMDDQYPGAWYHNIYDLFFRGLSSIREFADCGTHILTFNYDRSLEHYLFKKIRSTYPCDSEQDIWDAIQKLKIIHLHGSLGDYWGPERRIYSPKLNAGTLKKAADGIRIIHDDDLIGQSSSLSEAHKLTKLHTKFHFLGFGYDLKNMLRLNLLDHPTKETTFDHEKFMNKTLYGTWFEMPTRRLEKIRNALKSEWKNRRAKWRFQPNEDGWDISKYFDEHHDFI